MEVKIEKLLTVDQVAKKLGVSDTTVKSWIRSRKLIAEKIGGRWLTDEHCLQQFEVFWRK